MTQFQLRINETFYENAANLTKSCEKSPGLSCGRIVKLWKGNILSNMSAVHHYLGLMEHISLTKVQ